MAAVRPRARSSSVITCRAWTKKAHTRTPATSAPVPTLTSTTLLRRLSRRTRPPLGGPGRGRSPGAAGGLLIAGLRTLPPLQTRVPAVQSRGHEDVPGRPVGREGPADRGGEPLRREGVRH